MIDFAAYHLLLQAGVATSPAKASGFVSGAVFGYFAHGTWTFRADARGGRSMAEFASLYAFTLTLNVAANAAVLAALQPWWGARGAAFLAATGLAAVLNFLGMKFLVFRQRRRVPVPPLADWPERGAIETGRVSPRGGFPGHVATYFQ